jgi:hypothetical protein
MKIYIYWDEYRHSSRNRVREIICLHFTSGQNCGITKNLPYHWPGDDLKTMLDYQWNGSEK